MTQPYRPPTGSPRGWKTKSYDPYAIAPLAHAVAAVGTPTVWCGRNVSVTVPAARAIMAGETRTGVLPAQFPFKFGNITHQPVVTVSDTWFASANAGVHAPNVWTSKARPPAVSATVTAPAPNVFVITSVAADVGDAAAGVHPPTVTIT